MTVKATLAIAILCLAGCVTSNPVPMGNGVYMVSARVPFSGETGAKSKALQEGSTFCTGQGATLQLISTDSHECALHGGCGEAQVTFKCVHVVP